MGIIEGTVAAALIGVGGSLVSQELAKQDAPDEDEASKIAAKQQRASSNSMAAFARRQRFLGPSQLRAPGLKY